MFKPCNRDFKLCDSPLKACPAVIKTGNIRFKLFAKMGKAAGSIAKLSSPEAMDGHRAIRPSGADP